MEVSELQGEKLFVILVAVAEEESRMGVVKIISTRKQAIAAKWKPLLKMLKWQKAKGLAWAESIGLVEWYKRDWKGMRKELINEFVKAIDREPGAEMKAKVKEKVVEITTEVIGRVFRLP